MTHQQRLKKLEEANRLIMDVAGDLSKSSTDYEDYEWGWLEGLSISLTSFIKTSGARHAADFIERP